MQVPHPTDPGRSSELKTVSLALRGSGFLIDTPDDNKILINGELQQEALVKKFQASKQLRVDGVFGKTTRVALGI